MGNRYKLISLAAPLYLLLGLWATVCAQPLRVGISGGMVLSTHTDKFRFIEEVPNLSFRPKMAVGYRAGLIGSKALSRNLRVQFEPSVIKMGARYNETFTYRGFEFRTKSSTNLLYLQLPILMQFTFGAPSESNVTVYGEPLPKVTFHVTGGLFGDYLLDARFTGTNTSESSSLPFEGDFSQDVLIHYSRYDAGPMVGVGLELNKEFGFETRFQHTLIQTYRSDPSHKPKNLALTFSLYYLL